MSMIKVENLTLAYPGSYHNIFENCSFQIDTDWKLGFTGRQEGISAYATVLIQRMGS